MHTPSNSMTGLVSCLKYCEPCLSVNATFEDASALKARLGTLYGSGDKFCGNCFELCKFTGCMPQQFFDSKAQMMSHCSSIRQIVDFGKLAQCRQVLLVLAVKNRLLIPVLILLLTQLPSWQTTISHKKQREHLKRLSTAPVSTRCSSKQRRILISMKTL